MESLTNRFGTIRRVGVWVVGIVIILFALSFLGNFAYFFETVQEQEIGVRFRQGQIREVVGPGVYSDIGLFVDIQRVSTQAIPFTVQDDEIITQDKQRIGLIVSGDIFRPNDTIQIRDNWSRYRGIYLQDNLALDRVSDLARQAMKVCIGDRTFDENIIGTARDELRACVDSELNDAVDAFGLSIENLVVPEVILSPEVQVALDAIVQSRLATEKAAQDELRERAQAQAEQARQEGEIRVEQSRLQEQTRQQTLLAELEQQRLGAQLAVIEAERTNDLAQLESERQLIDSRKANELLAAERDLAINTALADAAEEQARADLANQTVLANLLATNPDYLQLRVLQVNADALNPTDKVIFTPEGTTPTLVLPGPGIVPTVDTTGTQTSQPAEPPATDSGN
ncbi:MAG: SPFH domain-containing protein [Ardenticatenaceae bacterium]|nr:SPFH domain-containing protein [Ardenticatenaceae bacterium]